jgi:hypothetical protein
MRTILEIWLMSRSDELSSTFLAELKRRAGLNPVLGLMIREGCPLTVEEYINVQWSGEPPEELNEHETKIIALLSAYELLQQDTQAGWPSNSTTRSRH